MVTDSKSNPNFLPEASEKDFLPPINRWITFGGLFILCVLGLSIPVAAIAKYKVTVVGQAVVRPSGELRIVQATAEGQVMQVHVKENQTVKKGDAIATIDDSRLQTKKSQLQNSIQQYKLQLAQLNAQIKTLDYQIRAETERVNRTVAGAKASLLWHNRAFQEKKVTTASEWKEADANVGMARSELLAAEAELKSIQSDLSTTEATLKAAVSKRNRYKSIANQGALSLDQFEEVQLAVKQQQQAVLAQKSKVIAQEKTILRLKKAIQAAIARRQRTQASLNPTNVEVTIATEEIAKEKAAGEANKAIVVKERQALINQEIEVRKQLLDNTRELKQIEIELEQTTVKATALGIISKLNLRNNGQTVRMGEELAQIVPSNAPLVVKAAIESEAKSKVKIGQKVLLRVSACPYPDYGTLSGKVKSVSPDAIHPQNNNDSANTNSINLQATKKSGFYEVTIEPKAQYLGNSHKKCQIQLGMDGRADIITHEESVLQFFLRRARLITDL